MDWHRCSNVPECSLTDESGMRCDGGCGKQEMIAGMPMMSCRTCDIDLCWECGDFWQHRATTGWTHAHRDAAQRTKGAGGIEVDQFGWTPLHWVCFMGCEVALLENYGTHFEKALKIHDAVGQSCFMLLCRSGNLESVKWMMGKIQPIEGELARTDSFGRNPLEHAVLSDLVEVAELLIGEKGKFMQGHPSLAHHAVYRENVKMLELLLKHDQDNQLNHTNEEGLTPLTLAAQMDVEPTEFMKVLLRFGADTEGGRSEEMLGMTALLICCAEGNVDGVRLLVEDHSANVSAVDSDGNNGLHYTIKNGDEPSLEIAKILIRNGLDVNQFGCENQTMTPLLFACQANCPLEWVKILGRADVPAKDEEQFHAIHLVCTNGNVDLLRYIIEELKFDSNARDVNGHNALHILVQQKDEAVDVESMLAGVKLLLEAGTDINAHTNQEKLTPLHYAVINADLKVVKLLVEQGRPNLDATDQDGDTPLHNVCGLYEGDHRAPIVKYLLSQNASFKPNHKGFTPLATAAAAENRAIAAIFVKRGLESCIIKPESNKKQKIG